jgi:hypothetical protein
MPAMSCYTGLMVKKQWLTANSPIEPKSWQNGSGKALNVDSCCSEKVNKTAFVFSFHEYLMICKFSW